MGFDSCKDGEWEPIPLPEKLMACGGVCQQSHVAVGKPSSSLLWIAKAHFELVFGDQINLSCCFHVWLTSSLFYNIRFPSKTWDGKKNIDYDCARDNLFSLSIAITRTGLLVLLRGKKKKNWEAFKWLLRLLILWLTRSFDLIFPLTSRSSGSWSRTIVINYYLTNFIMKAFAEFLMSIAGCTYSWILMEALHQNMHGGEG